MFLQHRFKEIEHRIRRGRFFPNLKALQIQNINIRPRLMYLNNLPCLTYGCHTHCSQMFLAKGLRHTGRLDFMRPMEACFRDNHFRKNFNKFHQFAPHSFHTFAEQVLSFNCPTIFNRQTFNFKALQACSRSSSGKRINFDLTTTIYSSTTLRQSLCFIFQI